MPLKLLQTLFVLFLLLVTTVTLKITHLITIILRPIFSNLKIPLTPYDAIFATDSREHPHAANVTFIFINGRPTITELQNKFRELVAQQQFEKLLKTFSTFLGYFYWEDFHGFDIKRHVFEGPDFTLFEDEDVERKFCGFLGEKMTEKFGSGDYLGPLWDCCLVKGYKGGSVLVLRVHHCFADGYSQNMIVDWLLSEKSEYMVKKMGDKNLLPLLLRAPHMLTTLYRDALTSKPNFYTQKKTTSQGHISMTTLDLQKFKEIRRKTCTHFASIGMSLMCGALRRHYLENKSNLPETVSIMHSLPKPGHPLNQLINHWGVGLFKIPISLSNALERLLKTEEYFIYYTKLRFDDLLHLHMPLIGWFPRGLLKRFFNINFGTSMGFTSVPSVARRCKIFGSDVVGMGKVFGFQWGQTAVATAVYTYADMATVTMYCNQDVVPDQEGVDRVVKRYLIEEFDALYKEVGVKYSRVGSVG